MFEMQRVPLLKAIDGGSQSPVGTPRTPAHHSSSNLCREIVNKAFIISLVLVCSEM